MGALRRGWVALGDSASEWDRELEPVPSLSPALGSLRFRRLLTNDADADSTALLGPAAGMGGHTAVGSLVLRPHLREEQHGAGGKGQGYALVGEWDRRLLQALSTHPILLPLSPQPRPPCFFPGSSLGSLSTSSLLS